MSIRRDVRLHTPTRLASVISVLTVTLIVGAPTVRAQPTNGLVDLCLSAHQLQDIGSTSSLDWKEALADGYAATYIAFAAALKGGNGVSARTQVDDFGACAGRVLPESFAKAASFANDPFATDGCVIDATRVHWLLSDCDDNAWGNVQTLSPDDSTTGAAKTLTGAGLEDTIIRGFVAFIESRVKAEAVAAFVTQLKDSICAEVDNSVTQLLPSTCALVAATDDPYAMPVSWSVFQAAFQRDLLGLPQNVVAHFKAIPAGYRAVLRTAVSGVVRAITKKAPPTADALVKAFVDAAVTAKLDDCGEDGLTHELSCGLLLLGRGISWLQAFEQPLIDTSTDGPVKRQLAVRILLETFPDEVFNDGRASVLRALARARDVVEGVGGVITDAATGWPSVGDSFDAVEQAVASLKAAIPKELTKDSAAGFAAELLSLSSALSDSCTTSLDWLANTVQGLADIGGLPAKVKAPLDVFAERLGAQPICAALSSFTEAAGSAIGRDYMRSFLDTLRGLNALVEPSDLPVWFRRYGQFIVEVASAQSSGDVEKALEAAAAPVGSFRYKRVKDRVTASLNAYAGASVGRERLHDMSESTYGGLFAPVGIEVSYGVCDHLSLGVLVSIVDVGTLLSFTDSDDVETAPAYTFKQIFSPGLWLTVGISHTFPASLGFGMSIVPDLRTDADDGSTKSYTAFRFGGFLAFDLPVFIF